jgi:hypothetical protein
LAQSVDRASAERIERLRDLSGDHWTKRFHRCKERVELFRPKCIALACERMALFKLYLCPIIARNNKHNAISLHLVWGFLLLCCMHAWTLAI